MLNRILKWFNETKEKPTPALDDVLNPKAPIRPPQVVYKTTNGRKTVDKTNKTNPTRQEDSSFTDSALIAYATNSTMLGVMLGGDVAGAVLGDSMNSDCDSSSSYSSCDSSYDSGGSSDYSSGGDF